MCTLTLIRPAPGRLRAIFSRDEQRSRPDGEPPRLLHAGDRTCLAPLDPQGGGTWFGVNDAGLFVCLLNRNDDTPQTAAPRSRGQLPLILLELPHAHLASQTLAAIDASAFGPCTLVCADAKRTVTFESSGDRFRQTEHAASAALMLTSSGLGDALVEQPRRTLWHSLIEEWGSPRSAQAAFHAHRWPTAPHLSVCMEREDARTVSITTATRSQHGWLMTHTSTDAHGQPRTRHRLACGDGVPA